MKKYLLFLMSVFFFVLPSLSFADNAINFTPVVTVRGVFTNFVFRNNLSLQNKDVSVHYDLLEVSDRAFPITHYPNGIVQFREPRGFRASDFCAQALKEEMTTYLCQINGQNLVGTYFTLIPTDTGAVMIKNILTGKCLSAETEDTGFPDLKECALDTSQPDEVYKQLWFLAPAFGPSAMSPLLQ